MSGNADHVRNYAGATMYIADRGTTAPTNLSDAWPAGWEEAGYLDEDSGIEVAIERSTTMAHAYGGDLVRTMASKQSQKVTFVGLENNPLIFDLINPGGAGSSASGVTTRTRRKYTPNPKAFGLELIDGEITTRLIIPKGEVVDAPAAMTYKDDALAMYSCPISAYVYDSATGAWAIEITDDPAAVVA